MSDTLTLSNLALNDPTVFQTHQAQSGIQVDWFREAQQAAWSRFLETPTPVRTNEQWRFSNLARIRELGEYNLASGEAVDTARIEAASPRMEKMAGRIIIADETLAAPIELAEGLADKGVIFTTLLDAVSKHPDLLHEYFMQQSPEPGSEKFEALHLALLRNGVFLYVPDDVEVEDPFVICNWANEDKGAIFPHTLFVAGKQAKASLVEFQKSAHENTEHLVIANAHLYAAEGAQPSHTIIQDWNRQTLSFQLNTKNAWGNTQAKSTLINIGSIQARQEVHGKIFGSDSNVEMYALNVPTGDQEFDQRTLQTHIAPNSRSDLLFKNALFDQSRTIFSGLIIVGEEAQQTDAYQTNRNLMMSDEAEANSLPGLEIKANDVKCSHGATTGRMDDSELFYFLARGIPRKKAQELMVFGYCEEIIAKLDNDQLADLVRELIQTKLTGEK